MSTLKEEHVVKRNPEFSSKYATKEEWFGDQPKTSEDMVLIDKMLGTYPNLYYAFDKIQYEQRIIFCQKMLDYGIDNISTGKVLNNKSDIGFSLTGIWFRLNDKIQRFKNLILKGGETEVKNESLSDTFLDIANYGIICKLVNDGNWVK